MRYKARGDIYHSKKYYTNGTEYKPDEIPTGLTEEELGQMFRVVGIPDGNIIPHIDSGVDSGNDDQGGDPGESGDKFINIDVEHSNLIEYATSNGVNAKSNWKPETIIKKLEEAGITGEDFEYFRSIDWSLEYGGDDE